MTSVVFIPCSEGCIIISDRQDTHFESRSKTEVKKLYLQNDGGPAVGCAGPTLIIEKLFTILKENVFENDQDLCASIKTNLPKIIEDVRTTNSLMGHGLYNGDLFLESLIVARRNDGKITVVHLRGFLDITVNPNKITIIPEQDTYIRRFLNIDSTKLSLNQALKLGELILKHIAFYNFTVGPPEYHGYDFITLNQDGIFVIDNETPIFSILTNSELLSSSCDNEED